MLLKDGGTGTCTYEPTGKPVPVHLLHNFEYSTCYIKPDSMKPGGWRCFTAYPEQYQMVALLHKERRAKLSVGHHAVLEHMEELEQNQSDKSKKQKTRDT